MSVRDERRSLSEQANILRGAVATLRFRFPSMSSQTYKAKQVDQRGELLNRHAIVYVSFREVFSETE